MRSQSIVALSLLALISTSVHAEESSFHNILTISRSIISPSQYYQHKEGLLLEADISSADGSVEVHSGPFRTDLDVKGTKFGAAGFLALSPTLVLGLRADQDRLEFENSVKSKDISLRPSVTYSPVQGLSLAAQVNVLRNTSKVEGEDEVTTKVNNFTIGMTAHSTAWEATAVISTKKEGSEDEESIPQEIGIHGRYRIIDPITLGVSFEQRDDTGVAEEGSDAEDQTKLGVHMESAMSETFAIEVDFYSTTAYDGQKNNDATEFVLLGQALITPTLEAGAQVSYLTIDGDGVEAKLIRPGIFISTKF